jgi:hypothetical protein
VDGDGEPMAYVICEVIRDPVTRRVIERRIIERCEYAARSEVYDRVAQLNRPGGPTRGENQSWGRLNKATRQPAVKSKAGAQRTAAEWVELLMNVTETRMILQAAIDNGRKLSPDDVRDLMMFRCVPGIGDDGHLSFPLPTAIERRRQTESARAQPSSNARHETRQAIREVQLRAQAQSDIRRAALDAAAESERKLMDAVSRQILLKLGIGRTNWKTLRRR